MPVYELVLQKGASPMERIRVGTGGVLVGRSAECDVSLIDQLVSRRHARVFIKGDKLLVEDLGSSNGIEVNDQRVKERVLGNGDRLTIGEACFKVVYEGDSTLGQSVISAEKAAVIHREMVSSPQGVHLPVLYRASELLGTVFELDKLLQEILNLIFEALPVKRGYILTGTEHEGKSEIRASRSDEKGNGGPPLSHTLLSHVFETQDAMLTVDAQKDNRFEHADSIVGHEIHAAMCAPLCGRNAIAGAIYVDSGTSPKTFKTPDLELLATIARIVGIDVENARLYRENVDKERYAAIGVATAGLGHCIKNMVTAIRGGTEFINMSIKKQDIKYLEKGWPMLLGAIERIDHLVLNMLSYSKAREPERLLTDLNQLVHNLFDTLQKRATKANVTLDFKATDGCMIEIDHHDIYRVLMNLTLNAIDACEGNEGTVSASTALHEDGCSFCIEDTGTGIPDEIYTRLSEAFVSSKGSSGTGLGLACTYKIVREHGGRIDVVTEIGKGTSFNVFLPSENRPGKVTKRISLGEEH